jgi:hypothetical protein
MASEGIAFKNLRNQISIEAMKMLEIEWKVLTDSLAANISLCDCHCQILMRYGSAWKHLLPIVSAVSLYQNPGLEDPELVTTTTRFIWPVIVVANRCRHEKGPT